MWKASGAAQLAPGLAAPYLPMAWAEPRIGFAEPPGSLRAIGFRL